MNGAGLAMRRKEAVCRVVFVLMFELGIIGYEENWKQCVGWFGY